MEALHSAIRCEHQGYSLLLWTMDGADSSAIIGPAQEST